LLPELHKLLLHLKKYREISELAQSTYYFGAQDCYVLESV